MTFVDNSINLIINQPNKMTVNQYVFNLTGSNITNFQSSKFSTNTKAGVL